MCRYLFSCFDHLSLFWNILVTSQQMNHFFVPGKISLTTGIFHQVVLLLPMHVEFFSLDWYFPNIASIAWYFSYRVRQILPKIFGNINWSINSWQVRFLTNTTTEPEERSQLYLARFTYLVDFFVNIYKFMFIIYRWNISIIGQKRNYVRRVTWRQ